MNLSQRFPRFVLILGLAGACSSISEGATLAFEGVITGLSGNTSGLQSGQSISGTYYVPDDFHKAGLPKINLTSGSEGQDWLAASPSLALAASGETFWSILGNYSGFGASNPADLRGFTTWINGSTPDHVVLNARGGVSSDFSIFTLTANFPSSSGLLGSGLPGDTSSFVSGTGRIVRNATDDGLDSQIQFDVTSVRTVPEPSTGFILALFTSAILLKRTGRTLSEEVR